MLIVVNTCTLISIGDAIVVLKFNDDRMSQLRQSPNYKNNPKTCHFELLVVRLRILRWVQPSFWERPRCAPDKSCRFNRQLVSLWQPDWLHDRGRDTAPEAQKRRWSEGRDRRKTIWRKTAIPCRAAEHTQRTGGEAAMTLYNMYMYILMYGRTIVIGTVSSNSFL